MFFFSYFNSYCFWETSFLVPEEFCIYFSDTSLCSDLRDNHPKKGHGFFCLKRLYGTILHTSSFRVWSFKILRAPWHIFFPHSLCSSTLPSTSRCLIHTLWSMCNMLVETDSVIETVKKKDCDSHQYPVTTLMTSTAVAGRGGSLRAAPKWEQ